MSDWLNAAWVRLRDLFRGNDPNAALPWCFGCPDHEACGQGACYLSGGPLDIAEARRMRDGGMTQRAIARQLRVSDDRVARALREEL